METLDTISTARRNFAAVKWDIARIPRKMDESPEADSYRFNEYTDELRNIVKCFDFLHIGDEEELE